MKSKKERRSVPPKRKQNAAPAVYYLQCNLIPLSPDFIPHDLIRLQIQAEAAHMVQGRAQLFLYFLFD